MIGELLNRRTVACSAIACLSATLLCFLPLFGLLAYPFCLAIAIIGGPLAVFLGHSQVHHDQQGELGLGLAMLPRSSAAARLFVRVLLQLVPLLVLPLLIVAINALRVKNCDPMTGLLFYLLMPVCGILLTGTLGALSALLIPSRTLGLLTAYAALLGLWLLAIVGIYTTPAVFIFDPTIGFFPGAIYDEGVQIESRFVVYRLYNLAWLLAAFCLVVRQLEVSTLRLQKAPAKGARRWTLLAGALLLLGGGLFWQGDRLGFRASVANIAVSLGGKQLTKNFTIYYPRELSAGDLRLLAEDHEFRLAQITPILGQPQRRITAFIFRNADEKRRLMGAANTYIAKPWRSEIYLHGTSYPQDALKHELVHAVAAHCGDRLLGLSIPLPDFRQGSVQLPSVNLGLVEGLAVAIDWPTNDHGTIHQAAAALRRRGWAPDMHSLLGLGFYAHASSRAYAYAGSFVRFLLDRYGAARLRALYRSGGAFEAVYRVPLSTLQAQWHAVIDELALSAAERRSAEQTFRRPSIFARPCPHTVARLRQRVDQAQQRRDLAAAIETLERLCRADPGTPWYRLQLADALLNNGDEAASLSTIAPLRTNSQDAAVASAVDSWLADHHWRHNRLQAARAALDAAAQRAADVGSARLIWLKRWALDQPREVRKIVFDYLDVGRDRPRFARIAALHQAYRLTDVLPQAAIGWYLVGKQLAAARLFEDARQPLQHALELGLSDPRFTVEAYRTLGRSAFRANDFELAARSFSLLRTHDKPQVSLDAEDWLQRIHWTQATRHRDEH